MWSDSQLSEVHRQVSQWFAENGRALPWRESRDPWAILVAEVMLQQTQVARAVERWAPFVAEFPTPAACAAVPVSTIIDRWVGLGFNRRAVNLHRCAVAVVERHGGRLPGERSELLALPGIGPYTARAIRVFAFEEPDAVLDTNVARIAARVRGRTLGRSEAQQLADKLANSDEPWIWNQALLDLGSLRCKPRTPDCSDCPLQSICGWLVSGYALGDPAVGSAASSKPQSRFDGSDRQGRGRLVAALRSGPVEPEALAVVMGWPKDAERARRVAATLADDGLVSIDVQGRYELPGSSFR